MASNCSRRVPLTAFFSSSRGNCILNSSGTGRPVFLRHLLVTDLAVNVLNANLPRDDGSAQLGADHTYAKLGTYHVDPLVRIDVPHAFLGRYRGAAWIKGTGDRRSESSLCEDSARYERLISRPDNRGGRGQCSDYRLADEDRRAGSRRRRRGRNGHRGIVGRRGGRAYGAYHTHGYYRCPGRA